MAYDKAELEQKALEAIKKNKIKFMSHIVAFLPCSLSTFYEMGLEKSETLKSEIEINRTSSKVKALNRWEKSKNPTLEVAFYKLIGDSEEVERLNGSNQKHDVHLKGEVNHTHKFVDELLKNYGDDDTSRD